MSENVKNYKFDCPRMNPGHGYGKAEWEYRGKWRACSHCGSMNPDDVIKAVKEDVATIEPTTKDYKKYIRLNGVKNPKEGPIKFYTQHFNEKKIEEYNNLF